VPKVSATCHIGIAIFDKTDVMNRTLGTASNKIYEYAATGLPILFYDNEHFRRHLSRYNWAFPVDLSAKGLLNAIREIDNNYASLSAQAHADFETNLNFEHHFREVKEYIRNLRVAGKPNDLKNSISAE
jgi:hypothetical protein